MAKFDGFVDVSQVLRAGIYLLCHRGQVVYVGKSKSMYSRIYTHRNQWNNAKRGKAGPAWLPNSVKGILFDEVHIQSCMLEECDRLEAAAIARFQPKYNTLLKPSPNFNRHTKLPDLVINGIRVPLGPAIASAPALVRRF